MIFLGNNQGNIMDTTLDYCKNIDYDLYIGTGNKSAIFSFFQIRLI